jgi:CotS family spore coat protein
MHNLVGRENSAERSVIATDGLKRKAEQDFGFRIKTWTVIKDKQTSSYIAKIVTDAGNRFALKSLFIDPERQRFIVYSEELLAQRGVGVARPVPTLGGDLFMIYNESPYVLYPWIDGDSGQLRDRRDLESMVQVMACFHEASRKLTYPTGVQIYGHTHWVKEYKQRLNSMKRWHRTHKASTSKKKMRVCAHTPFFIKTAEKALEALQTSRYEDYRNGLVCEASLVHGDFHNQNLIFRKQSGVLIDFEDVRYDLPSKDLLRIFSMYTKKHPFQPDVFLSMMKGYERVHPLEADVMELVRIDMLYPHIFERMLRKKLYSKMSMDELEQRLQQEVDKAKFIDQHYFKTKGNENGRGQH